MNDQFLNNIIMEEVGTTTVCTKQLATKYKQNTFIFY